MTPLEIIQNLLKLLQKCELNCGNVATEIAYYNGELRYYCEEHKHRCAVQTYSAPEKPLLLAAQEWCKNFLILKEEYDKSQKDLEDAFETLVAAGVSLSRNVAPIIPPDSVTPIIPPDSVAPTDNTDHMPLALVWGNNGKAPIIPPDSVTPKVECPRCCGAGCHGPDLMDCPSCKGSGTSP